MVFRIIDPAVVGIYNPLCASALFPQRVYVALFIISVRKDPLIVSEMVSADAEEMEAAGLSEEEDSNFVEMDQGADPEEPAAHGWTGETVSSETDSSGTGSSPFFMASSFAERAEKSI